MISYLAYMYYYVIFYEDIWTLPYDYIIDYNITLLFEQVFEIKRNNSECDLKRLQDLKMSVFQALFTCLDLVELGSDTTTDYQSMVGQVDVINIYKSYYTNLTTEFYIKQLIKSYDNNITLDIPFQYNCIFYADVKINYYPLFMSSSSLEDYIINTKSQMRYNNISVLDINNKINSIRVKYQQNVHLMKQYITQL